MIDITIGVRYSCHDCGIVDQEVQVKAREAEDVVEWMDKTAIVALCDDHRSRSPDCHPQKLSDIKIPITGADRVGGAPAQ